MRPISGVVRLTDAAARNLEVENSRICSGRGIPSLHGGSPEGAEGGSRNQMPLNVEEIVDGSVDGDKTLRLSLGFEALHLALSSPHRKVRVFRPVVLS